MDEPMTDSNCGLLCGYHCCRDLDWEGNPIGMYLMPLEYEAIQKDHVSHFDIHSAKDFDIPPKLKKMYYIYCHDEKGCIRELRPIVCRTYPFEPHLENGKLQLVILNNQFHSCPLLDKSHTWRREFVEGVYKGWQELLRIPQVRYYVEKESKARQDYKVFPLPPHLL